MTTRKFVVGDKVRCINDIGSSAVLKNGSLYTVVKNNNDGTDIYLNFSPATIYIQISSIKDGENVWNAVRTTDNKVVWFDACDSVHLENKGSV